MSTSFSSLASIERADVAPAVYINLPVGGIAAFLIFVSFRTPSAAKPQNASAKEKVLQMDIPGLTAILGAMICYLFALQWGGISKSWNSADVIGVLVGFGLLLILFVLIEYVSGDRGLVVRRLVASRTIGGLCTFGFFAAGTFYTLIYYLPIYFQTTRGVSAQQSGIDNIPLVLAAGLSMFLAGGVISGSGHFGPILAVGTAFSAVGAGLIYTLEVDSSSAKWIGYQVLLGLGVGAVLQIPMTVCQNVVDPSDIGAVSGMVLFFQSIGASVWVSAAQAGFANRLIDAVPRYAPGVNPALVVATGATDIRSVFSAVQLRGVLEACMDGLKTPFAISIACACTTFVLSFGLKWEKIRVKI